MFGFPTATLLDCHGRYAQNVAFFSEWVSWLPGYLQSTCSQAREAEDAFIRWSLLFCRVAGKAYKLSSLEMIVKTKQETVWYGGSLEGVSGQMSIINSKLYHWVWKELEKQGRSFSRTTPRKWILIQLYDSLIDWKIAWLLKEEIPIVFALWKKLHNFLKLQVFHLCNGIDKRLHPVRIQGIDIKYLKFFCLFSEIINCCQEGRLKLGGFHASRPLLHWSLLCLILCLFLKGCFWGFQALGSSYPDSTSIWGSAKTRKGEKKT